LGAFWRTYLFIEGAQTYDVIEKPEQAYHAARAFGEFQGQLADLPGSPLHETIPFFHHTPRRVEKFEKALEFADPERRKTAEEEIKYARAQSRLAGHLLSLGLPVRVTHNDTKLNNVMLDASTGQAVCVIDLDTVMPGLVAYDFGDMVRTATMPVKEDERDVTKVVMQWPMFAALAQGYIEGSREFLTRAEAVQLSFAGWLMTFEVGIRFLTDYLEGDVYFKVHRPGHNLDRCRTQFALARDIDHNLLRMETFVRGLL
jgi:Ser/Thr protein kinase RdoA (MazF antagonist)